MDRGEVRGHFVAMDLDNGRVVFGETSSDVTTAMVKDPACGMEIDKANAAAAADHEGEIYYFCSAGCKARFLAAPQNFVSAAESP
jgi:P-type Cu+ transporter